MLGTIVNILAILAGTTIGMLFRNGIPEKYNVTVFQAIALSVILIGLKSALGCPDILVIIISLAAGAIIGEFLAIEAHLKALEMDPNWWLVHLFLGQAYTQKEMFPEAISELQEAVILNGSSSEAKAAAMFLATSACVSNTSSRFLS